MSIALYFGKINMSSSQLGDVITNNASFRTILSNVLNALKDDITYTHHYTKQVDNKTIVEDIEYSLSVKEKNDNELIGYIHKKSYLNYKDFDKNNKEIIFTSLEYRILLMLFTNQNKLITREQLLEKIWNIAGNFVNDNTLTVYIKRIREKLEDDSIIKTIRGLGYRIGD